MAPNSIVMADALLSVCVECGRAEQPKDGEVLAAIMMTLSWVLGAEKANPAQVPFNAMMERHAVKGQRLREAVGVPAFIKP